MRIRRATPNEPSGPDLTGLTVRPQFAHGRVIRLHVMAGSNVLGSHDLTAGTWQITHAADTDRVQAAIQEHLVNNEAAPTTPAGVHQPPVSVPNGPTDLSQQQPAGDPDRAVALRLAGLHPSWQVLHQPPASATISHLVTGPGGVFALISHAARGKQTLKGTRGDLAEALNAACAAADAAKQTLSAALRMDVAVAPVLVLVGARKIVVDEPHPRVHVVTDDQVLPDLSARFGVLSAWELDTLQAAARQRATWLR